MVSINKDNLSFYTEAVIYNPYKLNAKVKSMQIDVFINDEKIGTITEGEETVVKKRQTTHIPLNIRSRTGILAKNLFSQTGNLILGKIVTIEYKGYIKLKALANSTTLKVKIDGREHFKLSDLI
jgi:LEA14-like dessication related protein